jgi:hypothetical protein
MELLVPSVTLLIAITCWVYVSKKPRSVPAFEAKFGKGPNHVPHQPGHPMQGFFRGN